MQPSTDDLERLRQAYNRKYPGGQIGPIADENAALEHLVAGRMFWDGAGRPLTPEARKAIETAPPAGAFS